LLAKNDDAMRLACRVPLWERCLLAKNDDAMRLACRVPLCGAWSGPHPGDTDTPVHQSYRVIVHRGQAPQ
ncbi:hypothetical protein, partial [Pseudomonas syringae]|uniref:hypothetical protein n=1 Tax=Pseudomonas syringae TaxID=317 RepID=UPI000516B2F4